MNTLFLDIETIPAQSEEIRRRIAATVKAPGNIKKADSIALWEREQKQAAVDEAVSKSGLDGAYGQICCIGMAFGTEDVSSVSWPSAGIPDEAALLRYFAMFIETTDHRAPTIVGHNVAAFDIRFIWQRAMVLGVRMPSWFPRDPKPWSSEVFDTMVAWAGKNGRISLDNLCAALGLLGKTGVDGSMIGQMWADGKHEEIALYCREDVERVRRIHNKMRVAFGEAA